MYYDRIKRYPKTHYRIDVIETATHAVWDGNHGMGHVVAQRAMHSAIEKAKLYGLGAVAVANSTHYGICGYMLKWPQSMI